MKRINVAWTFVILVLVIVFVTGGCGPKRVQLVSQAAPLKVTVLFFNDIHGYLLPFHMKNDRGEKVEVGGIARMAHLIKEIRSENRRRGIPTLVLVAGDILQGTPMSTVFKGKPDVEIFNRIGVDVMTVGNHEFDFGFENFLTLKDMARFPMISSNIVLRDTGQRLCPASAEFELGDHIKLTVVGATTQELLVSTTPANVVKVDVMDSVETVAGIYDRAKDRGPVILLSHNRHQTDRAIAEAVPGLLAVIAGHDQILFSPHREAARVPIFEAFEKGKYLGRLDIEIDRKSRKGRICAWNYIPVSADIPLDPEIGDWVAGYASRLDDKFKEVIGHSEAFLDGERERIRYEETNLGNFIADILREYTSADIALINAGTLRASIDQGPVTVENVFNAMPYPNEIVTVKLSGRDLMEVLNRSVRGSREDEDGGFMHVSGIRITISGRRITEVVVGAERVPLNPERIYTVGITEFIATGGDGYEIFKDKPQILTGLPLRELLVDTIRARKTIAAKKEGRIVRR